MSARRRPGVRAAADETLTERSVVDNPDDVRRLSDWRGHEAAGNVEFRDVRKPGGARREVVKQVAVPAMKASRWTEGPCTWC